MKLLGSNAIVYSSAFGSTVVVVVVVAAVAVVRGWVLVLTE